MNPKFTYLTASCIFIALFPLFIPHLIQEGTGIEFYLQGIKQSQPYILVIGSRASPLQVFVLVERRAIEFKTLLKAVDYCFKLIYVLDIEYQHACFNVWQFLEVALYGIPSQVPISGCVRELRTYLSQEQ